MLRALDGAVCRQIHKAAIAGITQTEIARKVGVNPSRIGYILRRERAREKHAAIEAEAAATARTDLVAELRAADAERAAVRATPRFGYAPTSRATTSTPAPHAAHDDDMTVQEPTAEIDLATGAIRGLLAGRD
jgi:transcriptional regulator with XRE-family HTH domain